MNNRRSSLLLAQLREEFTHAYQPRIETGNNSEVEVDISGSAVTVHSDEYMNTVHGRTWQATVQYANSLKSTKSLKHDGTKIAFFNSTPQGGGVALMRHALIRFLRAQNVNATWYVPTPRPIVFRITKDNHNILQGVEKDLEKRLTPENMEVLDDWCYQNAGRHWIGFNGPLASRIKGGADVIIIDDPQMPALVRQDLADDPGTPTSEVWDWVWENIQDADLFICHPVPEFVPRNVTPSKVGYLPATTDWLDGLNKDLSDWDFQFYMHDFQSQCKAKGLPNFDHPDNDRKYIVQIARYDPAKGIPDALASYARLRGEYMKSWDRQKTPQLVLAGHGAIDDPDALIVLKQIEELINKDYATYKDDIIFMRLDPSDQLLNALMSGAHVALQLSTREGFEVKVSEALHKGIPIIATRRGGIPLQVQDGKSGFLVEVGDHDAVARHLLKLFEDDTFYNEMAEYAKNNVSDEVSTVGNALAWLYMCDILIRGEILEPYSGWINDMAREAAGLPYLPTETRLPRDL